MIIQIKNRWYGNVIFECEADSIREACEKAVTERKSLSAADLRAADLSAANLSAANLRDADLSAANLSAANLSAADLRAADLRAADLSAANLSDADLSAANLRAANLRAANLRAADLSAANLSAANLSAANLSVAANLESVRVDFFDVLLRAATNGEVPGLIAALKEGRVDGSTYEGACSCLVGTIANMKGCRYDAIPELAPNSSRPAERFFLAIGKGDTPKTNGAAKIALEWAEDFQRLVARIGSAKTA